MMYKVQRNANKYLDKQVEHYVRLYNHLIGPGHQLSSDEALREVLTGLANDAKKWIGT